jgi:hypothetical protein
MTTTTNSCGLAGIMWDTGISGEVNGIMMRTKVYVLG